MFDVTMNALIPVNLSLHDGEGSTGSSGSTAGNTGAQAGNVNGSQATATGNKNQSGKPVVLYGKQPDMQTGSDDKSQQKQPEQSGEVAQSQQKTPEQRRAEYMALRNGEYKDLFDADVQNIINKRFREMKTLETQVASMNPIIEILSERYGTDDVKTILHRLEEESLETLADKAGMTVEQYEEVMRLRRQNKQLMERQKTLEAEQKINAQVAKWNEEAMALRGTPDKPGPYPNFDLRAELQNPDFMNLLKAGVSVKAAFEVCHMSEILANTAKKVEQNTVDNIVAKGSRPQENAVKGNTMGVIIKADPSKFTKEDREEIARRVMRGETIRL